MARLSASIPIRQVTVLEDRAHIRRSGTIDLPAGASTIVIEGVAVSLSDKTLTATLAGPGTAPVTHVRVTRRPRILPEDQRPEVAVLLATQRSLLATHQAAQEEAHLLEAQLSTLSLIGNTTIHDISDDAAWSRDAQGEWKSALDRIREHDRSLRLRKVEVDQRIEDGARDLADLAIRVRAVSHVPREILASAEVEVRADTAGSYELTLIYLVPGACWRPYHTARLLEQGAPRVEITCDACIWQNTGEDWTGVDLRCSTERSSLGTAPPLMQSDHLSLRRRDSRIVVDIRTQAVETTGGDPGAANEVMGIDDGGEPQLLRCTGSATVISNGMPHRLPLFTLTSPATPALVVLGEIVPAALVRTRQANSGTHPLLAGPVDLIRRNGLAGRSSILYIAPGATFDLGWGPDADIRVQRDVSSCEEKSGMLSGWTTTLHQVDVHLSNLGDGERHMEVTERIPVSSLAQVRVEVDATGSHPAAAADEHGFLRWPVTMTGHSQTSIRLRYRIKKQGVVDGI